MVRTRHLPEIEQNRLANRDPTPLTVTRGVLKGASEFVADGFLTTLDTDPDVGVVIITVIETAHENHVDELASALESRFGLTVTRDGNSLTIRMAELRAD